MEHKHLSAVRKSPVLREAFRFAKVPPNYAAGLRAAIATTAPLLLVAVTGYHGLTWTSLAGFNSVLVDKGPEVQTLATKYAPQLATLAKIDPATQQALAANPNDLAAGAKAVSEIGNVPVTDVVRAATLSQQYAPQLQTAAAVDQATATTLLTDKTNTAAITKAVGEIATKFGIGQADAVARLQALGTVPPADLLFLSTTGTKVAAATNELKATGAVPKADLAYLQANAADVVKAKAENAGQWETWWWVCIAGQLLFVPFVFVMAGRWSPRKAREDERAHEEMVQRELAALEGSGTATTV